MGYGGRRAFLESSNEALLGFRQELDAVAPGVGGVEAAVAGEGGVPGDRGAGRGEARRQVVELSGIQAHRQVGLAGGDEIGVDADVELAVAEAEPAAAAGAQRGWLGELLEAEEVAKKWRAAGSQPGGAAIWT
jgi:hypothetical protein